MRQSALKPNCEHRRGTWCACRKFVSHKVNSPKTCGTIYVHASGYREECGRPESECRIIGHGNWKKKEVFCYLCGHIIKNPEYTPAPHDAHGACIVVTEIFDIIEEGHSDGTR